MKKVKRGVAGLLALTMTAGLMVTGCGNGDKKDSESKKNKDGSVTVSFWAASVTEERQQFFDWFADYVHEVYPDITVDMLGVPGDLSDYRQKLDVAIQAGTAPDITNDFRP